VIEAERALLKSVEGTEAQRLTNTNPKTNTKNIRKSKYKPNKSYTRQNKSLKSSNITPNPKVTSIGEVVGDREQKRTTGSRSADEDGGRAQSMANLA
jgi:hypothetical protein